MVKIDAGGVISKNKPTTKRDPVLLDTLGQLGHNQCQQGFQPIKRDKAYLKKRAKNAYFSKGLAQALTQLDSPLNKAYRRTLFDCCSTIMQEGKKLTARYCDARWCNTCNRIRVAKLLNGYLKPLSELKNPHFVTLTIPNVNKAELKPVIAGMIRTFQNIVKANRRAGNALNGVRKLECTYNAVFDTYHPHFHMIIDGNENGNAFIAEWLKRYPFADIKAQDNRPCKGIEGLKELFKYTTKIVTKTGNSSPHMIYVSALDTTFKAMYGVRTFQSFGNVKMVKEEIEELEADEYEDIEAVEFIVWQWKGNDWHSMIDNKPLTNYIPSKAMIELLTKKMIE
jgi:hypothetical protein